MSPHILTEKNEGVLHLSLHRPEKKNALTQDMYEGLLTACQAAADDPEVRAVLLKSSGRHFTAGNDLQDFATVNREGIPLANLPVIRFIQYMIGFPKPLIAAVQGVSVGIGTTVLLHCDSVIAGTSSRFILPFTPLALVPEFASSTVFPQMAGLVRARHYFLTGAPFSGQVAYDMGLVSVLCDNDDVPAKALRIAQQMAAMPAGTVRAVKQLLNPPERQAALQQTITEEMRHFEAALHSEEHGEALAAFFEKRKPDFSRFT